MQQILSKLANPGIGLLILGAALVYGARALSKPFRTKEEQGDKIELIFKGVGMAVAIIGASTVFTVA